MGARSSLVVVRLTPPGRGAIATVLVEGPGALAAVGTRFRSIRGRPLRDLPPDRLAFGHFGPEPGEEVVVRARSHEAVEVHCHGGRAAVEMVERVLVDEGCRRMDWRDWARECCQDPIAADAWIALAEARTERTAAILLDQYLGALRRAIAAIEKSLVSRDTTRAKEQVEELLTRAPLGLHLVRPWRVVVAGAANVGKSSLVNALLGYARAIVDPAAGTTRDVVTAVTAIDGWPVELCDTAGLRPTGHPVEQAGIELAERSLSTADLVLLVFDLSQPWSAVERGLLLAHPAALVVHSKADLAINPADFPLPGTIEGPGMRTGTCTIAPPSSAERPPGIVTSVLRGHGVEDLLRAISSRLVPCPPEPGAGVPFAEAHVDAILRASWSLARGDIPGTRRALQSLPS